VHERGGVVAVGLDAELLHDEAQEEVAGLEVGGKGEDDLLGLVLAQLIVDALGEAGLARADVGEQVDRPLAGLEVVQDFGFGFAVCVRVPQEARIGGHAKGELG